jgi:exodeoxyribonuclease VII small subunit
MSAKQAASYRELNMELESILQQLQREDLDIDEALKAYERGLQLIKQLEGYLKTAQNKVVELQSNFSGEQ